MTLANQLTILRMCLVPALIILLVYGYFGWALIVFAVAGITDALDGLVARIRDERTELGTVLDPLADKLLVTGSLIVLSLPTTELTVRVPPWVAILSISRDAGILLGVLVFNLVVGRRYFTPSILGKATTVVHLAMVLWVLWGNYRGERLPGTEALFWVTAVLVVGSAIQYLYIVQSTVDAEPQ